jgi:hypothetical protein
MFHPQQPYLPDGQFPKAKNSYLDEVVDLF